MKFAISSFGCTMNQGEGELFRRRLISAGHDQIDRKLQAHQEGPDLNILFTCVVIQETERRMLKMVRELSENGIPLIVAGCLATTHPDKVLEIAPETLQIPPKELADIDIGMIEHWVGKMKKGTVDPEPSRLTILNETSHSTTILNETSYSTTILNETSHSTSLPETPHPSILNDTPRTSSPPNQDPNKLSWYNDNEIFSPDLSKSSGQDRTTFILPISQGCLGNCAYCLTKQARGTLSSYDPEDILSTAHQAVTSGRTEIQLTSQDTAVYGRDKKSQHISLASLLGSISSIEGNFRIRVGMMNPTWMLSILPDLIRSYRSKNVYSFLHMPIQSGDNHILKSMRRGYTVENIRMILSEFRKAIPELTFSTDIITGFPGEDEPSFDRSMAIVRELAPDIVNITRYSERPGTEAAGMKDQVHGRISKERSRRLTALRFEISAKKNESLVGREARVLVTEQGKGESVISRDDSYRSVVIKEVLPLGTWHNVEIVDSTDVYLLGTRI